MERPLRYQYHAELWLVATRGKAQPHRRMIAPSSQHILQTLSITRGGDKGISTHEPSRRCLKYKQNDEIHENGSSLHGDVNPHPHKMTRNNEE